MSECCIRIVIEFEAHFLRQRITAININMLRFSPFQYCGSQPTQHCYPETKCHRIPETQCVPVQKQKCDKVPVEVTDYVTEKQCLPFELDLDALSAQHAHGDPCASYQVVLLNNSLYLFMFLNFCLFPFSHKDTIMIRCIR